MFFNQKHSMEITPNQNKAVNDIVELIVATIGDESREIDTTDAISTTARLAGSFLYRSFGFKITDAKPGTAMLSEEANTKGPELLNLTFLVLQNYGIQLDNTKMSGGNPKKAESDFVEVIRKVQTRALEIMKNQELSYEQMAQSAAIATAFIIQQSSNITPEEGFGTAVYHYIEGTKTFPPAFDHEAEELVNENNPVSEKEKADDGFKPWWKLW